MSLKIISSIKRFLHSIFPQVVFDIPILTKRKMRDIRKLPAFYRPIPNPLNALRELQGNDYKTDPIVITLTSYYPRIKYCIPALKSLLKQNYPDYTIELNLWWDCKIPKNIQKFLDTHSNSIRVYKLGKEQSKEDVLLQDGWSLGVSPLRKLAPTVRRHSGKYIAVCDDDIIQHPYWLSTLYYNMQFHENKVVLGFTGYHANSGMLSKFGMRRREVRQAMPVLWLSGFAGYLLPKHVQNKPDLLAHMARCVQYNEKAKQVDDVVIASWLYCMGIKRVVVPRDFISRDVWTVPGVMTIYYKQQEHRKQTGKSIDEVVYETFLQHDLLEDTV